MLILKSFKIYTGIFNFLQLGMTSTSSSRKSVVAVAFSHTAEKENYVINLTEDVRTIGRHLSRLQKPDKYVTLTKLRSIKEYLWGHHEEQCDYIAEEISDRMYASSSEYAGVNFIMLTNDLVSRSYKVGLRTGTCFVTSFQFRLHNMTDHLAKNCNLKNSDHVLLPIS